MKHLLFAPKFIALIKPLGLGLVLMGLSDACKNGNQTEIPPKEDVEAVMLAYRAAWKQGDSKTVLAYISDDVVLYRPGKTAKPLVGKQALSQFWFPKSNITYPILTYEVSHPELHLDNHIAAYQGVSTLTWYTQEKGIAKDTTVSISEFTTLLRKEKDKWKIYGLMYTLKAGDYQR